MELITVNFSGAVRRERLHGREYLVAPLSMIVPGVLNGSRGPILYELDDIQASYDAWNAMPIVLRHPVDDAGNPVSARTPKVLETCCLGHVYNSKAVDKLAAEAWFDVELTRKIAPATLSAVQNGQPVEVSTGLNLERLEPTQGIWNAADGKKVEFTSIARGYRPDHLAILPEGKGACSITDGCGVNNAEEGTASTILQEIQGLTSKALAFFQKPKTDSPKEEVVTNEEVAMKLTPEQRTTLITNLIGSPCGCFKDKKDDLEKSSDEILTALNNGVESDKKLKAAEKTATEATEKIKTLEPIANAAKAGFTVGDKKVVINEKGEFAVEEAAPAPVVNKEDKAPMKLEDYPIEIQNAVRYQQEHLQKEKRALILKLIANIDDPKAKEAQATRLEKRSIEDLQADVDLIPAKVENKSSGNTPDGGWWLGAGAGQGDDTVLNKAKVTPLPDIDWSFAPAKN